MRIPGPTIEHRSFELALCKNRWILLGIVLFLLVLLLMSCRVRRLDEPPPDAGAFTTIAEATTAPPPKASAPFVAEPDVATPSSSIRAASSAPTASSQPFTIPIPPSSSSLAPIPDTPTREPDGPKGPVVIALGGAGSPPALSTEVEAAARVSFQALGRGVVPLEAVTIGVVRLENHASFNAGRGSSIRFDGTSIHMDALVMDSEGNMGAVAAIGLVQNPVRVAMDVAKASHDIVGGTGATSFARTRGHGPFDPLTPRARRQWEIAISKHSVDGGPTVLDAGVELDGGWYEVALEAPHHAALLLRTRDGRFAAAASDGGPSAGLPGRIGAVPIPGAAVFVGSEGAVVISGPDTLLIHKALAHTIYERMTVTDSPREAVTYGLDKLPDSAQAAAAAVNQRAFHVGFRGPVAWASIPATSATSHSRNGTGTP